MSAAYGYMLRPDYLPKAAAEVRALTYVYDDVRPDLHTRTFDTIPDNLRRGQWYLQIGAAYNTHDEVMRAEATIVETIRKGLINLMTCPAAVTNVASEQSTVALTVAAARRKGYPIPAGMEDGQFIFTLSAAFKTDREASTALDAVRTILEKGGQVFLPDPVGSLYLSDKDMGSMLSKPVADDRIRQPVSKVSEETVSTTYQQELMLFDPGTGEVGCHPTHAAQYRKHHGLMAWLFNPWSGDKRHPSDIGSDVQGVAIINK